MNLINDPWIPVIREDGRREKIAPWQIAEVENPVMDIAAPRADFQGALYQFLIGLLQTCNAPDDQDDWETLLRSPTGSSELKKRFSKYERCFDLNFESGFGFMQDISDFEGDLLPVEDIVGGELSDNTRTNNTDLFVKRNTISALSPYWAALALFNLQTSGVLAWGQHRVGLRGNGPLTTIVLPVEQVSLWHKLWLNVIDKDNGGLIPGGWKRKDIVDVFPWMGVTRTSLDKERTFPEDCNPLQHYWPMPRRVRLKIEQVEHGTICDISGESIEFGVRYFKRIKGGVLYSGAWQHPLSSYTKSIEKDEPQKVILSKNLSYGYRDWAALIFGDNIAKKDNEASFVVNLNMYERNSSESYRLWVFGYRAENANVFGYVDKFLPVFCSEPEKLGNLSNWASRLIVASEEVLDSIYQSVSSALWGMTTEAKKRNKNAISSFRKNNQIDIAFWNATETLFFQQLQILAALPASTRFMPSVVAANWLKTLRQAAFLLFDEWALEGEVEDMDMKRIITARKFLSRKINTNKHIKDLEQIASTQTTEMA